MNRLLIVCVSALVLSLSGMAHATETKTMPADDTAHMAAPAKQMTAPAKHTAAPAKAKTEPAKHMTKSGKAKTAPAKHSPATMPAEKK